MNLCISCNCETDSIIRGTIDGMEGIFCDDCAFWMDGNLEPHEKEHMANVRDLIASTWRTSELANFVRGWFDYHNGRTPVWVYVALDQEQAMALLDTYREPEVRDLCANALVMAGWNLRSINYKKS